MRGWLWWGVVVMVWLWWWWWCGGVVVVVMVVVVVAVVVVVWWLWCGGGGGGGGEDDRHYVYLCDWEMAIASYQASRSIKSGGKNCVKLVTIGRRSLSYCSSTPRLYSRAA